MEGRDRPVEGRRPTRRVEELHRTRIPIGGVTRRTALHALHVELGGKLVAFAGHELPIQYPLGILKNISIRAKPRAYSTCRTWVSWSW